MQGGFSKYHRPFNHIRGRRSIRLKGYDYGQAGMYFVTICVKDRENLFGEIKNEEMILNELGKIVQEEWLKTPEIRKEIELDEFIIMPNHLHGIVIICTDDLVGANGRSPLQLAESGRSPLQIRTNGRSPLRMQPKSVSSLMAGFKSSTNSKINLLRHSPCAPVWQRNYYEHIVRNEQSLDKIRNYIYNNPGSWPDDIENLKIHKTITEQQRKNYYKNIF